MSNLLAALVSRLSKADASAMSLLRRTGLGLAVAGVLLYLLHASGFETPPSIVVLGAIIGLTYGLLAVGLVLVYRSNRIINFAHGEVGAFASSIFLLVSLKAHLNYYVLLPIALLVGAGMSAASEVVVVRRLRKAPKLMSIIATLGVGQFLVFFGLLINTQSGNALAYPQPPGLPTFRVGGLTVTPAYSAMLVFGPATVIALAAFLRYSKYGLAIRCAAANPEAARMAGIPAARMSAMTWGLAGGLSALTAILTAPTNFTNGESFGPGLLLRALAAAVLARMTSLPVALLGGVGLGIIEQTLLWNKPRSGLVELVLFGLILVTLLLQKQRGGREEEKGSWAAVQAFRPVPLELQRLWLVRNLGLCAAVAFFGGAALLPLVVGNPTATTLTTIAAFAVVGLSVGIVTGLGGQLSLGQYAVAGVGAWVSYEISKRVGHFELAFLYAGLAGALTSLIIGIPALRIRGLFLTVTTLSFALVVPTFLLQQEWMFGSGVDPGRPVVGSTPLDNGRLYYWFALPVFALMTLIAWNVRRGGFSRLLIAVRDNEEAARAFTVRAALVKVQGFLLAGFIAGVGGGLAGHAFNQVGAMNFQTRASIVVVALSVIGGISLLAGPIIGAVFVVGVPAFLPLDSAGIAATALGQLLIIMYLPAGVGSLFEGLRDRVVKAVGRRAGLDVDAIYSRVAAAAGSSNVAGAEVRERRLPVPVVERLRSNGSVLLDVQGLRKSFGGVRAVRGVDFDVRVGETLGLIGPNGAGKTTTFELLGGFVRADAGRVIYDGEDITALSPEARARLGLIRSFQDAALFPTLTVRETVRLSLEREHPTSFFASVLGLPAGERAKQALTDDLLDFMGLGSYQSLQISELSTGTRRITEIACLVAMRPTLLLLDEPAAGVAQKETEALGALLQDLKRQLGLTLVIIEHDIPLIMRMSDRIVAMSDGEIIACGSPQEVRESPAVIEAYLGGSLEAIERSGPVGGVPLQRDDRPGGRPAPGAPGDRELVSASNGSGLLDLASVPGIGPGRAEALLRRFGSYEAIRSASPQELQQVPGVGAGTARRLREALR
jgi:ABC-type branched-subunit amino acid transport system ATPase component/ABC-type branched-subunit amino acid transport system permease subunit